MTQEKISFKPLNQGLGFHPYSEGLPYSPSKKSRTSNPDLSAGAGAVVAGRPTFARTLPEIKGAPVTAQSFKNISPVREKAQNPESQPQLKLKPHGVGYLARRILAYGFDSLVNIALCTAAMGGTLWNQDLQLQAFLTPGLLVAWIFFALFFNWAVVTAQEIAFGTSMGKRLFGLMIPGSATTLLARAIFFLPASFFCGFGLLWATFDKNRRCWHDIAAGVQPGNL